MIQRVALCITCLLILSACDTGNTSPSGLPANNTSSNSYVPIDLDTVSQSATGMIISGAIDHNTGQVDAFALPRALEVGGAYQHIEVETRNGYVLRFVHNIGNPAGTYPITTALGTLPPASEFSGGLLNLWSPDPALQYTQNPQGTVTIDYDNQNIIGSYSLTVQNPAGETIEIMGQFYTQPTTAVQR